jgi:starch synthase (maltosyl-transferring)
LHELVSDRWYDWRGPRGYVELDPAIEPAQIFVLQR